MAYAPCRLLAILLTRILLIVINWGDAVPIETRVLAVTWCRYLVLVETKQYCLISHKYCGWWWWNAGSEAPIMAKPKNVLFIMFNQLRWDYLICCGHPDLHTPNIDKLADKACGLIVPISSRRYVLHQGYRPTRGAMCTVEQPHLSGP